MAKKISFEEKRRLFNKKVIDKLAKDGDRLCRQAHATRELHTEPPKRSGQHVHAYFWVVVYNGMIMRVGSPNLPADMREKLHSRLKGSVRWNSGAGEDWWLDFYDGGVGKFINDLAPGQKAKKGFVLYVLNAAWYSTLAEKMHGSRIISQIGSEVLSASNEYKKISKRVVVKKIGYGGEAFAPENV